MLARSRLANLVPRRGHVARRRAVVLEDAFAPGGGDLERRPKRLTGHVVGPALPPHGLDGHKGAWQEVRAALEHPVDEHVLEPPGGKRLARDRDVRDATLERGGADLFPGRLGPADPAVAFNLVFEQQAAVGMAPKRRQGLDGRQKGRDREVLC